MTFTRRLVSGTAQLTLSNGVVKLLSIVTMPILTTLLSPQAYGVATLLGTIISSGIGVRAGGHRHDLRARISQRPTAEWHFR